jgi:hypothetical protein
VVVEVTLSGAPLTARSNKTIAPKASLRNYSLCVPNARMRTKQ